MRLVVGWVSCLSVGGDVASGMYVVGLTCDLFLFTEVHTEVPALSLLFVGESVPPGMYGISGVVEGILFRSLEFVDCTTHVDQCCLCSWAGRQV